MNQGDNFGLNNLDDENKTFEGWEPTVEMYLDPEKEPCIALPLVKDKEVNELEQKEK